MNVSPTGPQPPSEEGVASSVDQRALRAPLIGQLRALGRLAFGLYCRFTTLMFGGV